MRSFYIILLESLNSVIIVPLSYMINLFTKSD